MDTSSEAHSEKCCSPQKRKSSQCQKTQSVSEDQEADKYWFCDQLREDMRRKSFISSSSWGSYVWVAQSFTARLPLEERHHLPSSDINRSANSKMLAPASDNSYVSIS